MQKSRCYTEKTTGSHRMSNKFLLFLPSVVSCFHLCCLVGERQREKGVLVQSKWRQKHEDGVLNSLRPVRVGVEGSASGVVLKVTLFPGVRANSLAIYKNTTKCLISWMLIKSSEKCSRCNDSHVYVCDTGKWRLSPVWAMLCPRLTFWKVKMEDPATLDIPSSSSAEPRQKDLTQV